MLLLFSMNGSCFRRFSLVLVACLAVFVVVIVFLTQPVLAIPSQQPAILTIDLLQQRLKSLPVREGMPTIDLSHLIIDLRPENQDFQDQFYQLVQGQLQKTGSKSPRLDLSHSQILGELTGSKLGSRTPLYGEAQALLSTPLEQAQLQRDRRRLSQLNQLSRSLLISPASQETAPLQITVFRGELKLVQTQFLGSVNFANTFFLSPIEGQGAVFQQSANWTGTRFSQTANFTGATFKQDCLFRNSLFFAKATFNQTQFLGSVNFQGSEFQATASFSQAMFQRSANFSRVQWQGNVDFAQSRWQEGGVLAKNTFNQGLFLTEVKFDQAVNFRESRFMQPVNLRGAAISAQADFSDASFINHAYLNVADLNFDPDQAKLLGNPGQLGRVIAVPTLQGNETLLRNLVRNFRQLEQISDANQVEYTAARLRWRSLSQQLLGMNVNVASRLALTRLGLNPQQIDAIVQQRQIQPFQTVGELLNLEQIDLSTYVKVKDRLVVSSSLTALSSVGDRLVAGLSWVSLSLLLLLSDYGTNSGLVFGVGILIMACFGVMFWLVDRFRRLHPVAIVPTVTETVWVLGSFVVLAISSLVIIFNTSQPWPTLAWAFTLAIPVPSFLLLKIYQQGRYHDLMDSSYFTAEGSLRELRLLIGRLPIMPSFPFFRERYQFLPWQKRWNWLNYYDLSLNNLLRFGFNDIRLRDEQVPAEIAILIWYQWSVGVLYITLLLWTLSRTIPGLNLLIYFK